MRLLKTTKSEVGHFEIELFTDEQLHNLPYAILSHTWGPDEVTLQNINDPLVKSWTGYMKIEQCCAIAYSSGYDYVWIDTCCIDKTSSTELSEAINSMFLWYQEAKTTFEDSRWFTRGWTLQELIAPRNVIFFDGSWRVLGDKMSLRRRVSQCTRIPESILAGERNLDTFSTAQRMSWAAERQTTRVEDLAYCLMGLFGVNMPLIYGEREAAFIRLQEEILKISEDHSLFAWKSSDTRNGLLATSPAAFIDSHDIVPCETSDTFGSPLIISGGGIHVDVCFVGLERIGLGLAVLQCKKLDGMSTSVAIFVQDTSLTFELERFKRVYCDDFRLVDLGRYHTHQCRMTRMCVQSGRITRVKNPRGDEEYNNLEPPHIYPNPIQTQTIDWGSPRVEVYLWLLLTRSNLGAALNAVSNGRTPLSWAAENGLENYVRILLRKGATIEVDSGLVEAPLSLASRNGHTATVRLLLDKGAGVDAKDHKGWTPLVHAILADKVSIVKMLLDYGADINASDKNARTPLMHAIKTQDTTTIKMILNENPDIEAKDDKGQTPLMHAIWTRHIAIINVILSKNPDIEARNREGQSPLIQAIMTQDTATIKVILRKSPNIEARDNKHRTPLMHALNIANRTIIRMLLKKNADIEARNEQGLTPLMLAIVETLNGHISCPTRKNIIEVLILHGADINAKNLHGETPLSIATKEGHGDIVELLLRNGAIRETTRQTPMARLARMSQQGILKLFGSES
ncbi:hypothetical protein NYO67_9330 [Aspergillus flavus]|nr:hypothetical protein NYO67_9330 [Aspergillus flavus]